MVTISTQMNFHSSIKFLYQKGHISAVAIKHYNPDPTEISLKSLHTQHRVIAQSPHPIYSQEKAYSSKQSPWRGATGSRIARSRSLVRAPAPAGALRVHFILHPREYTEQNLIRKILRNRFQFIGTTRVYIFGMCLCLAISLRKIWTPELLQIKKINKQKTKTKKTKKKQKKQKKHSRTLLIFADITFYK